MGDIDNMTRKKIYNKAPIIEAVMAFSIYPSSSLPNNWMDKLKKLLSTEYPIVTGFQNHSVQFSVGSSAITTQQNIKPGIRLESADRKFVLRALPEVFIFSHRAPYSQWTEYEQEAKRVWDIFKKITKPKNVIRIGLRYINLIVSDSSSMDLKKYFWLYPKVPKRIKEPLSNFLLKLQIPMEQRRVLITQAAAPPKDGKGSVIFDIDIINERNFSIKNNSIWKELREMRRKKNIIFKSSTSNHARKGFA